MRFWKAIRIVIWSLLALVVLVDIRVVAIF